MSSEIAKKYMTESTKKFDWYNENTTKATKIEIKVEGGGSEFWFYPDQNTIALFDITDRYPDGYEGDWRFSLKDYPNVSPEKIAERLLEMPDSERDLKNIFVKDLDSIESGLHLYENEDGITGIEFSAGGRYIDILAVDACKNYVVIELKVSKADDCVIGQLLSYMGWIEKYQAEEGQQVRGIIIAHSISEHLRLACMKIPGVELIEYNLFFSLKRVNVP